MNMESTQCHVFPLSPDGVVVIPLEVPHEAICIGVNNCQLVFELGGSERTYELPIGDGMPVRIEQHAVSAAGEMSRFQVAVPDPDGGHQLEVTADISGARWFVAGRVRPRTF
ncbi:hypothetical protein E4T66_17820 [Sinimarinibacterium sp. CAU 1509]|uniref:hypothetical protein n=1 Tax=Sinimarinibacterium sp. CAU 1509 TaxID=2562283 RepID=UPI0010AC784A|nr:hypothetical protein [Sinimarinibacterium sp. CAU 1509]TJY57266.1 hypothetical protein E4T66_17820 [Sinimarinibacterium sp. CAU 1509]